MNLHSVSTTGLKRAIEFGYLIKAEVSNTKGNKANLEVISEVSSFNGKGGSDIGEPKCKGQQTFSGKHQIINIVDFEGYSVFTT